MQQGLPYLPQEQASRDQSGGPMGLLQQLLGREGQPNLPPMQDDSSILTKAFNDAQGIDPEKRRRIAEILSGRSSNDAARGPQPAGPGTPGDSSADPLEPRGLAGVFNMMNPFGVTNLAQEEARRRGGVE